MENGAFEDVFPIEQWENSIAMLVYRRVSIMIYPYLICNWGQFVLNYIGWILFFDFACFPPPSSEVGDVWFKIDVRKTTCGDDGDGYMWQHLAASWHITPLLCCTSKHFTKSKRQHYNGTNTMMVWHVIWLICFGWIIFPVLASQSCKVIIKMMFCLLVVCFQGKCGASLRKNNNSP